MASAQRDGWIAATVERQHGTNTIAFSKRLLDVVVGTVAFVMLAPLVAAVALLVSVTSHGPVLYRQQRFGQGGRRFTIYKFRTMVEDADEHIGSLLADYDHWEQFHHHGKLHEDPRVTTVGRILRILSLDELPQLINVLRGDMSLVGPRPRWAATELDGYGDNLDEYLSARPGLTGPWQVSGRSRLPDEQRVALDLDYVRHHSLGRDLRLLARTVPVLLWPFGRGAA